MKSNKKRKLRSAAIKINYKCPRNRKKRYK